MTQPTQAQIEAALKAYNASTKSSYPENAMKAALTAAAQVGEQPFGPWWEEAKRTVERDTIERCAQVCENLAAAIRKLKDAP